MNCVYVSGFWRLVSSCFLFRIPCTLHDLSPVFSINLSIINTSFEHDENTKSAIV